MTTGDLRTNLLWRTRRAFHHFHWLYKALDAALTAPLNPKTRASQLLKSVLGWKSSNYNRISSLLNLLEHLAPGLSQRISASLLRFDNFPFEGFDVRLLATGTGATVFLLDNLVERKVLKVFRRSLGCSAKEVWGVAREFKEKHEKLSAWFNHTYELVVPSTFVVLHGPLMGSTAAAVWQPYITGKKYDVFLDFSVNEAINLLRSDPILKSQWVDFSKQFLISLEENDTCFDLVGRENLMLVQDQGKMSLMIVDNGLFQVNVIRTQNPGRYRQLQAHVEILRKITEGLERVS